MWKGATPSDPLYRYLGPDPTAWEPETGSLDVDAVLVGEINSAILSPVSFTPNQLASRYAFTVSSRVELARTVERARRAP